MDDLRYARVRSTSYICAALYQQSSDRSLQPGRRQAQTQWHASAAVAPRRSASGGLTAQLTSMSSCAGAKRHCWLESACETVNESLRLLNDKVRCRAASEPYGTSVPVTHPGTAVRCTQDQQGITRGLGHPVRERSTHRADRAHRRGDTPGQRPASANLPSATQGDRKPGLRHRMWARRRAPRHVTGAALSLFIISAPMRAASCKHRRGHALRHVDTPLTRGSRRSAKNRPAATPSRPAPETLAATARPCNAKPYKVTGPGQNLSDGSCAFSPHTNHGMRTS